MKYNRFRRREPLAKTIKCPCGKELKMIKRKNYPHGKNSQGVIYLSYECRSCNKKIPLTKTTGGKK